MKTQENTIKKYMNFLGFLYITLEGQTEFNMTDACLIHAVNKQIPTLLKQRGILLNEIRGVWEWNYDYKPNPKMIESVLSELSNINNLQNKKRRRKMETPIKTVKLKSNISNEVHFNKVDNFLNELYQSLIKGNSIILGELHEKHGTPAILNVALKNLGIIHNYAVSTRTPDWGWIAKDIPSDSLTEKVIEEKNRVERAKKKKNSNKTLPKRIVETEVKKSTRGGKREGAGRKSKYAEMSCKKETETKRISLFWGLFNYETKK